MEDYSGVWVLFVVVLLAVFLFVAVIHAILSAIYSFIVWQLGSRDNPFSTIYLRMFISGAVVLFIYISLEVFGLVDVFDNDTNNLAQKTTSHAASTLIAYYLFRLVENK